MEALQNIIIWVIDDPYITIFTVTFTIGLLKACHEVMAQGFPKSAIEAMLVAAMVTIFCRAVDLSDGKVAYEILVLMGSGIAYLGFKHTEILVKSMLKILFIPIDKLLGTDLSKNLDAVDKDENED